jgi:flagellar export protein FliJ
MKRPVFPLQAVLTLRLRAEQLALENYARTVRARNTAEDALTAAEHELADGRRRWLNAMADGCPALRAAQMLEWCRSLEKRHEQAGQALRSAEGECNLASQALMQARQQREVVEKYLGNQEEKHERNVEREDRKVMDDLVQHRVSSPLAASDTLWN